MDEIEKLDAVQYAKRAEELLKNKVLLDALDGLEQYYLKGALEVDEKDDLGRFRYTEGIKVVRAVRRHLNTVIQNGKVESHQLESLNTAKKRRWNVI